MNKNSILTSIVIAIVALIGCVIIVNKPAASLGGVSNYYDTWASGVTNSTTSIGTVKTQVFSSITKMAGFENNTNSIISCFLDTTGTLGASSSVASGVGILVGGGNSTTSTIPSVIQFGECGPGSYNCYRHKGAVNCVADTTSTVAKWSL